MMLTKSPWNKVLPSDIKLQWLNFIMFVIIICSLAWSQWKVLRGLICIWCKKQFTHKDKGKLIRGNDPSDLSIFLSMLVICGNLIGWALCQRQVAFFVCLIVYLNCLLLFVVSHRRFSEIWFAEIQRGRYVFVFLHILLPQNIISLIKCSNVKNHFFSQWKDFYIILLGVYVAEQCVLCPYY